MNHGMLEVLVVDDNLDDVALMLRALRKHKFINTIDVVHDGAAAIEHIFGNLASPKVIFLDLKLPKLTGVEVLRKLKEDERTKRIPVVVLTSSQEDQDMAECYRYGVNSYVVKPVSFDDFARSISELGFYWLLLNQAPA